MKYRQLKVEKKSAIKEAIIPFDKLNAVPSKINLIIKEILEEICDLNVYKQYLVQNQVDTEVYSLSIT